MDDVPANGLMPDKKTFSSESHKVGLVYASAVPVDSYMNQGGKADFQARVGELILVGQYYGALKYAAESQKVSGLTGKRKVFLMPLGCGVLNNPWDIIVTWTQWCALCFCRFCSPLSFNDFLCLRFVVHYSRHTSPRIPFAKSNPGIANHQLYLPIHINSPFA